MLPLSHLRNQGESRTPLNSNSTISVRSSYFETEVSTGKSNESTFSDNEPGTGSLVDIFSTRNVELTRRDIDDSSHIRKVNISVQVDRSIIGQEDSLHEERKRWIRPPVVGQASSTNDKRVVLSESPSFVSSESEDEIKAQISNRNESASYVGTSEVFQNRKDYINEKPMEGGSDQSLPPFTELPDFQRIPTPSSVSSITPRPLEWDSGADVGYFQHYGSTQHNEPEFSSVEKMALEQGRDGILVRSDPEGTTSSKKVNSTVLSMIGIPKSESTPINTSEPEKKSSSNAPIKKSTKYQHLFPEVIIQNKGNQSDSNSEDNYSSKNLKPGEISNYADNKKLSSSLENLTYSKLFDHQSATFPRSQSQLNLIEENNSIPTLIPPLQNANNPLQSVSSSSITTVVTTSHHKTTKCIQTSNRKNSIGTQSSPIDSRGKHNKHQVKEKGVHNDSSTLESIQISTGDRVNSFEYLPGHMYECSKNPINSDTWEDDGVSLRNDVERGVQILEQFIQGSNANNTLMKKKLIQKVVKRLIHTDYPEDTESLNIPQRCTTRRSQNRDELVDESSSENVKTKKLPADNSTSLSGQSSSTWQSVTESTKSSDRSNIKSFVAKPDYKKVEDSKSKSTIDDLTNLKNNWKAPVTRTEKLYEHRKKGIHKDDQSDDQLLEFVNSERENQIDWIVKEINHLSNLKILLEKHERLRKNLNRLKKAKQKNEKILENDVKPTNQIRSYGIRRRPLHNMETFKRPSATITKDSNKPDSISGDNSWDSHTYEADDRGKLKKSVSTETRKEDIINGIRSTAYTITFNSPPKTNLQPKKMERNENHIIADRQTLAKKSKELVRETYLPTLQDHLIFKRPDLVSRAETRRKTVAELAAIRQLREEQRPVILAAALSCDTGLGGPPPPPLVKRVVSQKEMRHQTEKKYRQTFEVKKKISEQKLKESLKTNRLMADIYNKRLQLLTLRGNTNLSNSVDVISTM